MRQIVAVNRHTRTVLTLIAVGIITVGAVLSAIIDERDPLNAVAARINEHGYSLDNDDIYIFGGEADSTIRQMLMRDDADEDISLAIEASKNAGFTSDIDRRGEITVLIAQCESGTVTIYLIDGEIELCFIQTEEGEVLPL